MNKVLIKKEEETPDNSTDLPAPLPVCMLGDNTLQASDALSTSHLLLYLNSSAKSITGKKCLNRKTDSIWSSLNRVGFVILKTFFGNNLHTSDF